MLLSESMLDQEIEFTPIDICARNIVALAKNSIADNRIYHLYNHNFIKIKTFFDILDSVDNIVKTVPDSDFKNKIIEISKSDTSKDLLGIINDLESDNILINYNFTVHITSEYTQKYLHLLKCDWNETSSAYIKKLVIYMKKVNFI